MTAVITQATFTGAGIRRGLTASIPLGVASIVFGMGFGILARETGLTWAQAMVMSMTVFAGASQMVAMEAWATPPAVLGLAAATAAINIRHVVMGAALRPWIRTLPVRQSHAALTMMTDANWAMAMADYRKGEWDAAVLVGSGIMMWTGWVLGTGIGHMAGAVIGDPRDFGIDVIVPAFFALMLTSLWPGARRLHPWVVAAVVAIVTAEFLPGAWHVVAGGLAGAVTGAVIGVARRDG